MVIISFSFNEIFSSTDFNSYNAISYSEGSPKRIDGKFKASDNFGLGVDLDFESHGAIFIEWPEKIEKFNCTNEIDLSFDNSKSKRVVKITSNNSEISSYINRINV
mgnify:CR=1 FL=1